MIHHIVNYTRTDEALNTGTVSLRWALSEKPKEIIDIICNVLPQCAYHLILGSNFLTATKTFSKHHRRLVDCVFSVFNLSHFSFSDGSRQTLDSEVRGHHLFAIPDTGAERNVMSFEYVSACLPRRTTLVFPLLILLTLSLQLRRNARLQDLHATRKLGLLAIRRRYSSRNGWTSVCHLDLRLRLEKNL